MKNKLILLGMILSFQLFISDVFGQLARTVIYPNPNSLSGGNPPVPRSLIPNPNGGYIYFPKHKFTTGIETRPEIAFLDDNLQYVAGSPRTFTPPTNRGLTIHEAECIDPAFPNIYAVIGALTSANINAAENEAIVFLYDIVAQQQLSDMVRLGIGLAGFTPVTNITAGMGFVNFPDGSDIARCLVVHHNARQQPPGGNPSSSSTLSLLRIDPIAFTLTLQRTYSESGNFPQNRTGVDMVVWGNDVISLTNYDDNALAVPYLTRSPIIYNAGNFSIDIPNVTRRRINNGILGQTPQPRLRLNQIALDGNTIIAGGNEQIGTIPGTQVAIFNGIILETDLNTLFSPTPAPITKIIQYQDPTSPNTDTKFRSFLIDPTNPNRLAIYSTSGGAGGAGGLKTPQISMIDRSTPILKFQHLHNSSDKHAIAFLWTGNTYGNGGVSDIWSPMCIKNNQIIIATHGGGQNPSDGLRNSAYGIDANGLTLPEASSNCVSTTAYDELPNPVNIQIHNFPLTENTANLPNIIDPAVVHTNLTIPPTIQYCYTPPSCEPLVAQVVNCNSVQLSVPGYSNVAWTDGNNPTTTGPSTSISDLNCHTIVYSYEGAICTTQYKACIGPNQGVCAPAAMNQNQTEMTRWTLDNNVTAFASAQKQMKDGNKHTLCFEKYSDKNGKFEQISCEEVQSTEDLTKVEFDFTAYPSPASENITIEVTNFSTEDNYKAILFTSSGSNVKEFRLKSKTAQYSLDGVNSGSYILTMYQGNKKVSSKTIIVRK